MWSNASVIKCVMLTNVSPICWTTDCSNLWKNFSKKNKDGPTLTRLLFNSKLPFSQQKINKPKSQLCQLHYLISLHF